MGCCQDILTELLDPWLNPAVRSAVVRETAIANPFRWLIRFVWFIWFIRLIWFNQINKTNQANQLNEIDQTDRIDQMDQTDQLEFLHDPFGIAGQFHVALSVNGLSLCRAGGLDGAFPIGDLRAAFGREFLLCHAGNEFQ